jgi:AcrR family transcriptional regulator
MARPRSAGYDEQRELILAGAAELFARQGYPGTSMNEVALSCGLSKAAVYHYFADKQALLADIAQTHVKHLAAQVAEVSELGLPPRQHLATLIARFVLAYAGAQHAHRVLTEDVKFLDPGPRQRVLNAERRVVRAFAEQVKQLRPDLADSHLAAPLTMLLFGMINWMFTWMKPGGPLDHAAMAPVVVDLFLGGLQAVKPPSAGVKAARPRPRAAVL